MNPTMQKMFTDARIDIVKLPSSLSGVMQPNDLMSSHRDIKVEQGINSQPSSHASAELKEHLKETLAKYCTLDPTKSHMVQRFFFYGRVTITGAFSPAKIKDGYSKSFMFPYSPSSIIDKCSNLLCEHSKEEINRMKSDNIYNQLAMEVRSKGRVTDESMDDLGIKKMFRQKKAKVGSRKLLGSLDFSGDYGSAFEVTIDEPRLFWSQDIEWIESFPNGSITRFLLYTWLKKKTIASREESVPVVVDRYTIVRQRCCILTMPEFHESENGRLAMLENERVEAEEARVKRREDKRAQQETQRARKNRVKDATDTNAYQCYLCRRLFELDKLDMDLRSYSSVGSCGGQKQIFFCYECNRGPDRFGFHMHALGCNKCKAKYMSEIPSNDSCKNSNMEDDSSSCDFSDIERE